MANITSFHIQSPFKKDTGKNLVFSNSQKTNHLYLLGLLFSITISVIKDLINTISVVQNTHFKKVTGGNFP